MPHTKMVCLLRAKCKTFNIIVLYAEHIHLIYLECDMIFLIQIGADPRSLDTPQATIPGMEVER